MDSYIDRLASRASLTDAFATLEEPRTIVWVAIAWTWGSAANTAIMATIFFSFGETSVGWANIVLAFVFASCWFVFAWSGSLRATFALGIATATAHNLYVHVAMGGYANSGAFISWGAGVTVVAALALPRAWAIAVGAVWSIAAIVFGFLEEGLKAGRPGPDPGLPAFMFPYTMVMMALMLTPVVTYLLSRLAAERERSEGLLLNVLPESIAQRLKTSPGVIADDFSECTVLFADIVGFSAHGREVAAKQLIEELDTIFSEFDRLAESRGAQKIKTIGDGYMVVAGVPDPRDDHLEIICALALDMVGSAPAGLQVRIGINTGPVVAGIIGTSRFSYDLWGTTVNLASRMESYGEPGRIQVTTVVRDQAADRFHFEPAGVVDLKGFGPTEAHYLVRAR